MVCVDRVNAASLGRTAFDLKYYARNRPVLIDDGASSWPALAKWNPAYLDALLGEQEVVLRHNDLGIFDNNNNAATGAVQMLKTPFGKAVELIESEQGYQYYLQQTAVRAVFSKLAADMAGLYLIGPAKRAMYTNLWFGGKGCKTPLHIDEDENFLVQIHGRKRVTLFAPSETPYLYHAPEGPPRSQVNVFAPPDPRFPLYERALERRFQIDLLPGAVLYIPNRWWHAVESLDTSISVNTFWIGKLDLLVKWFLPRWHAQEPFLEMRSAR